MAKNEKTSRSVASKARKILQNPKSTKAGKSVAASALTQARIKNKSVAGFILKQAHIEKKSRVKKLNPEPISTASLIGLLKSLKPLEERFPDIVDPLLEDVEL